MRHSTLLTEFTDISQRLEYLVAHSSQLVFITGEDAAVQQGFVEAFLGQGPPGARNAWAQGGCKPVREVPEPGARVPGLLEAGIHPGYGEGEDEGKGQ